MARQFIVQLENVPGALATLAESLAERGVDLRAIGGGGIGDRGHVIFTTSDVEAVREVLVDVDDRPGGMARIARSLSDAGVNIQGHLFVGRWGDMASFAFIVDKPELARSIVEKR